MNASEKKRFIRELIGHIADNILAKVDRMPEEWDGHELRRYVADQFDASAMSVGRAGIHGKPYRARTRAYRNEVLVRNL